MAQTIKEKPTGGKPKVLSKAAQAPKELVKKGMLEAEERMREPQSTGDSPGSYAVGKVEQGIRTTGKKAQALGKKTASAVKKQVEKAHHRGHETTQKKRKEQTIKGLKNRGNAVYRDIRQKTEKGRQTIKTAEKSIKSAKSTAKTAKRTIKTAKQTGKASAKAAKASTKAARQAAKAAAQATRLAIKAAIKATAMMVKAAIAAVKGLIATIAAGGWVVVLLILLIGAVAALLLSPFGIFSGGGAEGTPSIAEVVQTINGELNEKISSMQTGEDADQVEIVYEGSDDGTPINNWPDILAVFAVKTNMDLENPQDVVVMDSSKVELLRSVFWDMTEVTKRIETETVEESEGGDRKERRILTIYVNSKGYEEMISFYGFSEEQADVLEDMMEPDMQQMILSMTGSTAFTQLAPEEIAEIRASLPEGISMDREKVVMAAYSLKGKVRYFWGGKSEAVGWDSRWGTPTRVTSKGSPTTGTTRPFGLDCSGYVIWCFIQAAGTADIVPAIGHGTANQWPKTQGVAWEQAMPGDLAFFAPPGGKKTNHVGVVVSNTGGTIMVAHCSSGRNDVVVTEAKSTGFKYIRRPAIFLGE